MLVRKLERFELVSCLFVILIVGLCFYFVVRGNEVLWIYCNVGARSILE